MLPAMTPGADGKHRQHRQGRQPEFLIVDRNQRQNHQHGERTQGHPELLHSESWCTGEDSNLRSPLGAADLQSAAINHSATCARPAEQNAWPGIANPTIQRAIRQAPGSSSGRSPQPPRDATSARNWFSEAAAGFSSLGELCVPAWLASVATPRGALKASILELAKGFEPPT